MQQNSTHFRAAPAVMVLLLCLPLFGCGDTTCRPLTGKWSNREGQDFYFQPNGKGLWLISFGSQVDTIKMEYRYDCQETPTKLDLTGFAAGPLEGKTLFGILEWTSDTSFRFDAEAGSDPEARPKTFGSEQTQKFFQEQE